ncbi:MAG: PAS domain-containing protein [Mucilaginibacter sp.]|nr:PAS domain-containing protein [Mucilaginibacter sp.]
MKKKLMEVFPDLEGQAFLQLLRDVLDTGKSVIIKETAADISATDGTPRKIFIDLGYEPLTDGSGKVTAILATVTDITEIVMKRQLLEASEELAKDLNEELAASNEEYITVNEELSALNEEYTAVNEELTAANEQLDEISRELQNANDKLSRANAGLRVENEHLLLSEAKALSLFADAPVAIGLLVGKALVVESANSSLLQLWEKTLK